MFIEVIEMEKLKSHTDLIIWQGSMNFVTEIYQLTKTFPPDEKFGLSSQIRRAGVSVPTNIAEGSARKTTKEYIQFLFIAIGSLTELETHLVIAKNSG